MDTKRGFGSRFGHIMALAGFCIGIGNMWKFPYMVGANGGGVFLIIYIISVIVAGLPLFILEQQLGRTSRLSGIAGMAKLAPKHKTFWSITGGWIGVITIILIAGYFWTILGWNIGYIFKVANGSFLGLNADSATEMFVDFSGSGACVGCAAIAAVLCFLIMSTDFKKGVEKVAETVSNVANNFVEKNPMFKNIYKELIHLGENAAFKMCCSFNYGEIYCLDLIKEAKRKYVKI